MNELSTALHPLNFADVDNESRITIVNDGLACPILKTVYLNGQELLTADGAPVTIDAGSRDLTTVTVTLIASSIEVITQDEAAARTTA